MSGAETRTGVTGNTPLTYAQLLEANNAIQICGDETYWLCVTRTVQGSKLFPVSAYILLSYANAFYRYPEVLRKIEKNMRAEDVADRCRGIGMKVQAATMGWCLPAFYLLGREWLLSLGLLRPQDAAEDIAYVMDFWRRFELGWHRNNGHINNAAFGHRSQILPNRRLEVFKADIFPCAPGEPLHEATLGFLATVSQYAFLTACECRLNTANTGPYKLDDEQEMLVRDFMDMGESSLPWLDGVTADITYNNLTVTMAARGCHFDILDDWGSFESKPEFRGEMLSGVGLYTSDLLTDGHVPVGMGSPEELTATLNKITEELKVAMNKLWLRMADWSRDQLMDAGALMYYASIKDIAHVAGCFEVSDWLEIDPRAERLRPILNDEYADLALGELVGYLTLPNQVMSPFEMMKHSNKPQRVLTPLPLSILAGEDYVPTVGPIQPGSTTLDPKNDRYNTTRGTLTLAEYNQAVRDYTPESLTPKYRFLCETWVKYNAHTELANELYRIDQRNSRTLKGRGTGKGPV